jgi:hypothetical protein
MGIYSKSIGIISVISLLNLVEVFSTPSYISNPTRAQLTSYTTTTCKSSSTDACCTVKDYFVQDSWYDTTIGATYSVTTSCYEKISDGTSWIRIQSGGLPNHPYSSGPSYVSPMSNDYLIELNQSTASKSYQNSCSSTSLGFGTVGFAINGVSIFSPLSANVVDALYPPSGYTAENFDICNAHPNPPGTYHYHFASPCLFGYEPDYSIGNTACYSGRCSPMYKNQYYDGDGDYASIMCTQDCMTGVGYANGTSEVVIGIALDGNLFYGPYDQDGNAVTGLDNCNGKFVDGSYQYYATDTFPYLIGCYGPGVYDAPALNCTTNPSTSYTFTSTTDVAILPYIPVDVHSH